MIKITVDTNVFISATFWLGASHKILELVEKKTIELILSKSIIKEYQDVLNYKEIQEKITNKNLEMRWYVQKIASLSRIVIPKKKILIIEVDTDDNKILECALAGNVDYIISQDRHLLDLKEFTGIEILHPEDFLKK